MPAICNRLSPRTRGLPLTRFERLRITLAANLYTVLAEVANDETPEALRPYTSGPQRTLSETLRQCVCLAEDMEDDIDDGGN